MSQLSEAGGSLRNGRERSVGFDARLRREHFTTFDAFNFIIIALYLNCIQAWIKINSTLCTKRALS